MVMGCVGIDKENNLMSINGDSDSKKSLFVRISSRL